MPKPKAQVNGIICKDPFLSALVTSDVDIAEERFREESRLAEEYSKVELDLQKRAEATSKYMQQVLELVRVSLLPSAWSLLDLRVLSRQNTAVLCRCFVTRHPLRCSPQSHTQPRTVPHPPQPPPQSCLQHSGSWTCSEADAGLCRASFGTAVDSCPQSATAAWSSRTSSRTEASTSRCSRSGCRRCAPRSPLPEAAGAPSLPDTTPHPATSAVWRSIPQPSTACNHAARDCSRLTHSATCTACSPAAC